MDNQAIVVRVANPDDKIFATIITDEMASSAAARGTGIAKRSPEYVATKMDEILGQNAVATSVATKAPTAKPS